MAKSRYIYVCSQCGGESPKWNGKCPTCGAWNTLEEELSGTSPTASSSRSIPDLSDSILELED
ncbi:MAG: DNA repair protein RadA, partial [Oscillospiraceae bacterium]|nr:DNA repair protein RadA [Oscillospiraceae bacterium]